MRAHLQRAYPMAVVATLEPLLGLFGTVLGMVGAFEAVALAGTMGDPSIMAEDIKRKAQSNGADAQITKPEMHRLLETVIELLANPTAASGEAAQG